MNEKSEPFCGGSLIDTCYVLTAAHCTDGQYLDEMMVVLKDHIGRDDGTAGGEDAMNDEGIFIQVEEIFQHPDYDNSTYANDIAVLKLESCVEFEKELAPICMPTDDPENKFVGNIATVTGWGALEYEGDSSHVLMEVNLPIISNEECLNIYDVFDHMICADGSSAGMDSCQGDSGG